MCKCTVDGLLVAERLPRAHEGFVQETERIPWTHTIFKETRAARRESHEALEANVWKAGRRSLYTGVPW